MKHAFEAIVLILQVITGILEGIEGIVLPVLLVTLGPALWSYSLARAHHTAWAVVVASLWLASIGIFACDLLRKAFTAVSLFVFLAWIIALVAVYNEYLDRFQ